MENHFSLKLISIVSLLIAVILFSIVYLGNSKVTYGYSDKTTHLALTKEIVRLYNLKFPEQAISDKEMGLVVKGSVDEDDHPRYLRHFYDPVNNKGFSFSFLKFKSSKDWAQDSLAQAGLSRRTVAGTLSSFFGGETDYSWERAIYEYVWGDKERAFEALGHVLHLIEDAGAPEHTRNDAHPPVHDFGSPLETWASKWRPDNFSVAENLKAERLPDYGLLEEYFDNIANYSNRYFFSKDTIDTEYSNPTIKSGFIKKERLSDGKNYTFVYYQDLHGNTYRLVLVPQGVVWNSGGKPTIEDGDELILSDYWDLLSKQIVLNGAGVVKLFFDEVEKEKETRELYRKNKSWFKEAYDKTAGSIFGFVKNIYGSSVKYEDLIDEDGLPVNDAAAVVTQFETEPEPVDVSESSNEETVENETLEESETQPEPGSAAEEPEETELANEQPQISGGAEPELKPQSVPEPEPQPELSPETKPDYSKGNPYDPGFGGGGGGGGGSAPAADTTAPDAPVITSPSDFSSSFATTTIAFKGTAESGVSVSNTKTTEVVSADGGNWSVILSFSEGTTTVKFFATDSSGNKSAGTEVDVGVNLPPNAPVITSPSEGSQFATTTVTIGGTAEAGTVLSHNLDSSTETVAGDGSWSIALSGLGQGTTTLGFVVSDGGLKSGTTTIDVFVDTEAPTIDSFSVLECDNSLKSGGCLAGDTTVNLSWSATGANHYGLVKAGGVVSTTTASSATLELPDAATTEVGIVAYDTLGNFASSTTKSVEVFDMPVVINEIAWAGTEASADDEWIELYNRYPGTIDLSNVWLVAEDGAPKFALSGTVGIQKFYLIERTNDDPTSVSADLKIVFSGDSGAPSGLLNKGEVLSLVHALGGSASSTLDATPSLSDCGGGWCAGTNASASDRKSMERVSVSTAGTTASNWRSHNGYSVVATDAASNDILGTPGALNSLQGSYYCAPETSGYIAGNFYSPAASAECTYVFAEFPAATYTVYGDLYKGIVGSSTQVLGHKLPSSASVTGPKSFLQDYSDASQGDDYFAAIFRFVNSSNPDIPDLDDFRDYFKTGTSTPSINKSDFIVVPFKWGTAP